MGANHQQLAAVLDAAQRLLSARQDQMLTAEEWERLAGAVEGATEPPVPANATRRFGRDDAGGVVVLLVQPDGTAYAAAREGIAETAMQAMRALPAPAGREG